MRRLLLLAFVLSAGCVVADRTRTFEIRQHGLRPGASGPQLIGTTLPKGRYALGLSALSGFTLNADDRPKFDRSGDVVADKAARLLIAGGAADFAELGLHFEVRPGSLARSIAGDVPSSSFEDEYLIIPGVQSRFSFGHDPVVRAGFIVDFAMVWIPYARDVEVETVDRTIGQFGQVTNTSVSSSSNSRRDTAWQLLARAGPFVTFKLGEVGSFTLGGIVGNQPTLHRFAIAREDCYYGGRQPSCFGETDAGVDVVHSTVVLTPYFAPALELGSFRLVGQLFLATYPNGDLPMVPGGELGVVVSL